MVKLTSTKSRSKKAFVNATSEILLEIVTALCGLILPRLILSNFGSAYNGITHSISQFISCIAILKSGIGSVTRAALYKPLADNDFRAISCVAKTTERFMRKVAFIFLGGIVFFALVFPFTIHEFDWLFTSSLVIILSISTFGQYYFGLTYQMVLQADQKNYIISLMSIASTVLNTIISVILINTGCSIHTVKLGSALVFLIPPMFYSFYVRRHYHIDRMVEPNNNLISQRWDAFAHQIANFVNSNTDVMLITLFLGVTEVSVYSVYYMIASMVLKVVLAFTSGTTGAFGNIIAKKEEKLLNSRFRQYLILVISIAILMASIMYVMYIPFIRIYTHNITDTNYIRPTFALLLCISTFFSCVKTPYQQIVYAAGKFKETRNGTIVEAVLNILITLVLINIIGISGAIIGTIFAVTYRSVRYSIFVSKVITKSSNDFFKYLLFSVVSFCMIIILTKWINFNSIDNFMKWAIYACIVTIESFATISLLSLLFFGNDVKQILHLIKYNILRRK